LWVLSSNSAGYGAASAQILAIYEIFLVFAVSVLLLAISLFLQETPIQKKGNGLALKTLFSIYRFLSLFSPGVSNGS
jgi:hypothetical protein